MTNLMRVANQDDSRRLVHDIMSSIREYGHERASSPDGRKETHLKKVSMYFERDLARNYVPRQPEHEFSSVVAYVVPVCSVDGDR